ncbi:MAG: diaminopimelate decarboxylase, partial [Lachnospiraceae bacterium]|nr:diaminopimelate decarboxylase [Lachnospiraceae bacterium]
MHEIAKEKIPFVTREMVEEIEKKYPTPFHIYDEKGIRQNARRLKEAFAWNKGFKEFFAVKATPNPFIIKILKEEGCGVDCASIQELYLAEAVGMGEGDIMFSSNETPAGEFTKARQLGAYINLDDITMIDFLDKECGIPETVFCRFNPGGFYNVSNGIMDNPGDSKYGMTRHQIADAFRRLKGLGVKKFGIHAFLCSGAVTNDYYPMLAKDLFQLAVELKEETDADICYINLSGGVGIPYRPGVKACDIMKIGEGVRAAYDEVI